MYCTQISAKFWYNKLQYPVPSNSLFWLLGFSVSCLSNRTKLVVISRVPQGFIWGPLLFVFFIEFYVKFWKLFVWKRTHVQCGYFQQQKLSRLCGCFQLQRLYAPLEKFQMIQKVLLDIGRHWFSLLPTLNLSSMQVTWSWCVYSLVILLVCMELFKIIVIRTKKLFWSPLQLNNVINVHIEIPTKVC